MATMIVTGNPPVPTTEFYGTRSLDTVFAAGSMGAYGDAKGILDFHDFGETKVTRVTTMVDRAMLVAALIERFGNPEKGAKWDENVVEKMYSLVNEDLRNGVKLEYTSILGLFALYHRSGGELTSKIREIFQEMWDNFDQPLAREYRQRINRAMEGKGWMTREEFFHAILAQVASSETSFLGVALLEFFDANHDDHIDAVEAAWPVMWAITFFASQMCHFNCVIECFVRRLVLPYAASRKKITLADAQDTKWGTMGKSKMPVTGNQVQWSRSFKHIVSDSKLDTEDDDDAPAKAVVAAPVLVPVVAVEQPKQAVPDPPMAFALMRNSHEALRAAIKEMGALVAHPSQMRAMSQKFAEYRRVIQVHGEMEDLNMFPLLDAVSGSPLGLDAAHVEDHALLEAVSSALSLSGDVASGDQSEAIKGSFEKFVAFHINHFVTEEKLMMPLTQKVHPTPQGRARAVHIHLVTPAMERSAEAFTHYIGWCTNKLNQYGSSEQPAAVAVRVFVRALHSASSASQWAQFKPVVKSNCSEEIWSAIVSSYDIEEPVGDDKLVRDASDVKIKS